MRIRSIWLTLVFLLYLSILLVVRTVALAVPEKVIWQMKQRDMFNTGRADYTVPMEKLNDSFFDVFLWQKLAPGPLSSTSMVFYDGAGPEKANIVVGTYHWPKGVQGMDRHSGRLFWSGNPRGGETIGKITPAFSNDGSVIYVVNDATESEEYPNGHPLMAFKTTTGPLTYWHNGADPNPWHLGGDSPTITPDGRIFLHAWVDRPYAGTDNGALITETWVASTPNANGSSDPALYLNESQLVVVSGGRWGYIKAHDGATGAELWSVYVGYMVDASVTIDPENGNIYVGCGYSDIYVAGLDIDGNPLWMSESMFASLTDGFALRLVYDYIPGQNNPQRAQATGCLSHDGLTYYFQTNSEQGDGRLYAINTADGSLKWFFETGSKGWEINSSSPIVTENGVIVVGNNDGGTYYAIKDDGNRGILLDKIVVGMDGNARASATISPDGILYLPLRTFYVAGNGDGDIPNYQVENLFCTIDITPGGTSFLLPPAYQQAVALNNAVSLSWQAITDPTGQFDYYAIYRATEPFSSVAGMTPIGKVADINGANYLDTTAINGISYYYAVTVVSKGGGEITDIKSIGPRTPRDETDLQVVYISRTPRYPRYAPIYTYYEITEPSGFGPYIFSAATGLGGGQDEYTQRWPNIGDAVTYTATVRNRGTNRWDSMVPGTWRVDGIIVDQPSQVLTLEPGDKATFEFVLNWDGESHEVSFTLDVADARSENNELAIDTKSVPFLSYIDVTYMEEFREETSQYPGAVTDDMIDWLNYHMERFNEMFADAGCQKRVHYDLLDVLDDSDPDPDIDRQPFAIFPFRFHAGEVTLRHTGYYHPDVDIDYGLLHEMGHQLGLIDLYQLDLSAEQNQVSGTGYYSAPECLMHWVSPLISQHSAMAMNHWLDKAHGYYGQYMYNMPAELRLRILDFEGKPLEGATIKMYQYCERPGQGKIITTQIKAQGITNVNGEFVLPNVPIDPSKVPPTYAGDELHDNPFGYLAVVGTNGVLHFRVEYNGGVDYAWLDITEVNVAYFKGQKDVAIFERQLNMGGPIPTKVNKALFLDEYGDYVDCGDAANNSLDIGTNATVELWVNFDSLPAANDLDTFVSKDEGGGSTNKWIFGYAQSYGHVSNQLFWHINTPGGYSDWVVSSSWIPSTGRWYHIAVVKSGSNYIFYKDGVQHGTDSTTIAVPDVNYNLLIGRAEGKFDFNGNIDEVRIFSIARTQEEIQANMNQPIKNPELQLNLVGYWNFDNGTANDSSSYGNHGTLMGDADIIPLVGTWPPPLRGDVSGNGQITAYDAALILQYVVGLIDEFPAERMSSPSAIEPHNYEISLPDVETPAGKRFQVPIAINDATGLSAGGITIKYDSTVLRAISYGSLELLNGYYWKANTNIQGEVRFAFATTEPTPALDPEQSEGEGKGQGNLLMVEFEVLPNTEGKTSSLVLDNVNLSNSLTITKINGSVKVIPSSFALLQNYPNPFNPDTWLPFKLAKEALVTIQIYNTKGQLIRTIALSNKPAGVYITKDKAAYWDGRDSLGEKVASGVYYYTLRAGGFMATRKMVIMK